jgi:hypothetical protein
MASKKTMPKGMKPSVKPKAPPRGGKPNPFAKGKKTGY